MERKTDRRGSLAHATASGLPGGAPEALRRAAHRALVREALGDPLGAQLVDLRDEAGAIVLVFAGEGWEEILDPHTADLGRRVGVALGRPELHVRVESRLAPSGRPRVPPPSTAPPLGGRRERLLAVARRLADRAARRRFC